VKGALTAECGTVSFARVVLRFDNEISNAKQLYLFVGLEITNGEGCSDCYFYFLQALMDSASVDAP